MTTYFYIWYILTSSKKKKTKFFDFLNIFYCGIQGLIVLQVQREDRHDKRKLVEKRRSRNEISVLKKSRPELGSIGRSSDLIFGVLYNRRESLTNKMKQMRRVQDRALDTQRLTFPILSPPCKCQYLADQLLQLQMFPKRKVHGHEIVIIPGIF